MMNNSNILAVISFLIIAIWLILSWFLDLSKHWWDFLPYFGLALLGVSSYIHKRDDKFTGKRN